MIKVASLTFLLFNVLAGAIPAHEERSTAGVCLQLSTGTSWNTSVHMPGSVGYISDIAHWSATSSQVCWCSVEPANVADLTYIIQTLGSTQTPFAVKGGGHATNPGFSSTSGVQIAMSNFKDVVYHADTQTVDVGSGCVWDDVYSYLDPLGVNVVGGRVHNVGVAGFTLGGGYSWLSNQYGLTVDNVVSYEIVLPDGTFKVVDASTPDLFFALKGGFNNFGIVTKFTLKAYPQGQVWGGLLTITSDHLDEVTAATAKFSATVTDPKAAIITTYNHLLGETGVSQLLFYDGPNPPAGIFDDFMAIDAFTTNVSTRSFISLVLSSPSDATYAERGVFNTVSLINYSENMLNAVVNESTYWGINTPGTFISYDVEPFLSPKIFSYASQGSSAYPPDRSRGLVPLNIYFAWLNFADDDTMRQAAIASAAHLTALANAEGQNIGSASLYGNYAIYNDASSANRVWGSNYNKLKTIKQKYDPNNIMALAGGWKL